MLIIERVAHLIPAELLLLLLVKAAEVERETERKRERERERGEEERKEERKERRKGRFGKAGSKRRKEGRVFTHEEQYGGGGGGGGGGGEVGREGEEERGKEVAECG